MKPKPFVVSVQKTVTSSDVEEASNKFIVISQPKDNEIIFNIADWAVCQLTQEKIEIILSIVEDGLYNCRPDLRHEVM
jgi:hypothetical protein